MTWVCRFMSSGVLRITAIDPDTFDPMLRIPIPRLLATVIFAVVIGSYMHHDYMKWNRLGRDAFLAYQDHRFDTSMAHPHSAMIPIASSVIVLVAAWVFYELLVLAISKAADLLVTGRSE